MFPFLICVSVLLGYFVLDFRLARWEALVLLFVFLLFIIVIFLNNKKFQDDPLVDEIDIEEVNSVNKISFPLVLALTLLLISSKFFVDSSSAIASMFGISDLVIGLTIVAVGTSMPELVTSLIAARKGQTELAIGNIVGSNVFNTLLVVGVAGTIAPMSSISVDVLHRDLLVTLVLSVLLLIFAFGFFKQGRINRIEGATLSILYIAYLGLLVFQSSASVNA